MAAKKTAPPVEEPAAEPVSLPQEPAAPAPADPAPEQEAASPPSYGTGSVKYDPNTMSVAVRTNIPDPDSNHDWGVMTVDRGGHYAAWDEVQAWSDLVVNP